MMQISPETQLFIRQHQTDDIRILALQGKIPKRRYADRHHTDSRKASSSRKNSIMERNKRYMVSKAFVTGTMFLRSHRPLQSNSFKRQFSDRLNRRIRD